MLCTWTVSPVLVRVLVWSYLGLPGELEAAHVQLVVQALTTAVVLMVTAGPRSSRVEARDALCKPNSYTQPICWSRDRANVIFFKYADDMHHWLSICSQPM